MKIRTLVELVDRLDEELAWRRRELSTLRSEIRSRSGLTQAMLLRAGSALLYAHWEGYVKAGCELYVKFVAMKRFRHEELSHEFVALCLRGMLRTIEGGSSPSERVALIAFLRERMSERARIPGAEVIETHSNLSSAELARVLATVGLDPTLYELKRNLIDEELVHRRNEIAHGRFLEVGVDDFSQVFEAVIEMMEGIREALIGHAVDGRYKAA